MNIEDIKKSFDKLKKNSEDSKKRKFTQTVDVIINLKGVDVKRTPVNIFVNLPHSIKEKKVAGFLEKKSKIIDSITPEEFDDFKDVKRLKKLVRNYDFFISNAKLMPKVATNFGRVLGQAGKMPSPQLGIITSEDEEQIKVILEKVNNILKIRAKESSIKFAVGKENQNPDEICENILTAYNEIVKSLPKKIENIKSVLIKFTMTPAVKVEN